MEMSAIIYNILAILTQIAICKRLLSFSAILIIPSIYRETSNKISHNSHIPTSSPIFNAHLFIRTILIYKFVWISHSVVS